MIKKLTATVFALAMTFPSIADVLTIKKDAPQQYVVQKGDTLWDISEIYLEQPWLWPKLWRMNPQIDNPHLIYPGDMLTLVYDADGQPMLVMNQKYKKLSPGVRKTLKKADAIPTVPLEFLRPYLTYEQALDEETIASKPYVLGANEAVKSQVTDHILYVKGDLVRSQFYGIYRKGAEFIDPESQEVLAHKAKLVGTARAFRSGDIAKGEPASVRVKNVKQEVKAGDFLMPAMEGQSLPAFFSLTRPSTDINGSIIASTNDYTEFSKYEVVVINRGTDNELKAGHILDIRRPSPKVIDGTDGPKYYEDTSRYDKMTASVQGLFNESNAESKLWVPPSEKVGELMVFKVYNNLSYAIIMETMMPIRLGDTVNVDL
ncbi:hypothetical protein PULV_a2228 [Pseudoalteromonas ulvae UL12]|uniref:LysM peptidoglycan-binding domain-containing protein n=1 Tax=Pseudoalteromonas ulvae TaxID=107327 RepID=UPI00186B8777|nr:LysM peptidoglycan-binding domain-containing protein [Pseudoalteromonas ulvae]MBE0364519.1 hypothetical protein [Pseudoalteromonas ulvae UL12]